MTEPRFGRLLTAMVTPFDHDGELDLPRAQELARRLIDQGTQALVVCGTTGESPTVFYDDKLRLFEAVLEAVDGSAPVIANAGDNCTDDSVAFARKVVELGVDGVMAVVPYYNKPPQEGLYRHFGSIASAVDVPVILYNIPGRSVVNLEASTTLRLAADFDNIVAVKEASSNLTQIAAIIDGAPLGFEVLSGNDEDTLPMMGLGATGVISVASHVAGPQLAEMLSAQASGDHTRALKIHLELMPLFKGLFMTANPIMVKKALELAGFPVGGCRLPLIPASDDQTLELATIMRRLHLLND
ncbi:4-hydroxy-tetrahydrodipicolinate synthase [Anaerosoma tenue]|uniref:4-hydroxy-tetrahydrodipicolinate synthase n=1 Tax=Anaerosoma tenue TaxID=2933588 RepID=UPI0022609716|nr:4-hydroxy-tetrahydrodipicolinate synthase [Anaerosoma tenue]MCK8114235.1 4-hydroxy-tetrahydrodipicolinate synthase [Anaerosoma tenue]